MVRQFINRSTLLQRNWGGIIVLPLNVNATDNDANARRTNGRRDCTPEVFGLPSAPLHRRVKQVLFSYRLTYL